MRHAHVYGSVVLCIIFKCAALTEEHGWKPMRQALMRREHSDAKYAESECSWLDGETLPLEKQLRVKEPTVIRNALNELTRAQLAAWSELGILNDFGHNIVRFEDTGGNTCGGDSTSTEAKLVDILAADCPGNTFLQRRHNISRSLNLRLREAMSRSASPLTKLLSWPELETDLLGGHISLGYETQWNRVHRHELTLFAQIQGSKGWVFLPPTSIPPSLVSPNDNHWNLVSDDLPPFDRQSVCGVFLDADAAKSLRGSFQGARLCKVQHGDAVLFPENWWHGTCNTGRWNAGVAFTADSLH